MYNMYLFIYLYIYSYFGLKSLKNKIYLHLKKRWKDGFAEIRAVHARALSSVLSDKQLQTVTSSDDESASAHTPQEFVFVGHITSFRHPSEVDGFFKNPFSLHTL